MITMCKTVFLTSDRFDRPAREFREALVEELQRRRIEVTSKDCCLLSNILLKRQTYGIALSIKFFRDGKTGCGLTLNEHCTTLNRTFAFQLSNVIDHISRTKWRNFRHVSSRDRKWKKYFKKVNAEVKLIFYLCTYNNPNDREHYHKSFDLIVKSFADEIVRCLRSDYDFDNYQKRVVLHASKMKNKK